MREDFLHYIWRLARFDLRELRTTEGHKIRVQNFGEHNVDAGPDFSHARLHIGRLNWAGNVEIHLKSSDWYAHGHEKDPAYDSVILHVVLEEDRPVFTKDGRRIPCLELRDRIPPDLLTRYWRLQHNEYWVACQNQLHQVPEVVRTGWLQRVLVERVGRRAQRFENRLVTVERNWEEAFFQAVARGLGGRVNADAMDMLARSIPLRVLQKHRHSLLQLEAIIFGQSGLLPDTLLGEDDYVTLLNREYKLLRQKHDLRPIPSTSWRFLRLRPANFPTVRLAQLATLVYRSGQFFGKALAAANAQELTNMFDVSLSNYWRTHYRFGKEAKASERRLGVHTVRSLIVNAVIPAYVTYGRLREDDRYRDRAFDLLESLPPEDNVIIRRWKRIGWPARSAADSQALLELHLQYCKPSRCTDCAVGCSILQIDIAPLADSSAA